MLINLPWPPSMNTYWRNTKGRVLISAKGRAYRKHIARLALVHGRKSFLTERLSIEILAYTPDRRKRDLDNLPKAMFDALESAGMFADDSQIDYFSIRRCEVDKSGRIEMKIVRLHK